MRRDGKQVGVTHKGSHPPVSGAEVQLVGSTNLRNLAVTQHCHSVADHECFFLIVGDEERRDSQADQ